MQNVDNQKAFMHGIREGFETNGVIKQSMYLLKTRCRLSYSDMKISTSHLSTVEEKHFSDY